MNMDRFSGDWHPEWTETIEPVPECIHYGESVCDGCDGCDRACCMYEREGNI